MSWGTLSGSDGEGLPGEKARVSWLTPSACGTDRLRATLTQAQTSDTDAVWVMRSPGAPATLSSVCNFLSPPKMSSFRPVSLGC